MLLFSNNINISSIYGASVNSAEPDQTQQNAASDQVLHCLFTECTFKILCYVHVIKVLVAFLKIILRSYLLGQNISANASSEGSVSLSVCADSSEPSLR